MATEKLLPNTKSGWSGPVGRIDEGIAAADGVTISANNQGYTTIGFDDSAVVDGDTVTSVQAVIRARSDTLSGTDTLEVSLRIGGVDQGTTQTFALTSSLANHTYSNAGWNSDWDESEMDGIQLRIRAVHTNGGEPDPPNPHIDAIDLNIIYTLDPNSTVQLPSHTITVTPFVPQIVSTEVVNNISELPSQAITVTPFVPTVVSTDKNISELPSQAITVTPFVPTVVSTANRISQLPSQAITVTPFVPTIVSTNFHISELPSQAITVTPFVPTVEAFQSQISQLPSQAITVTPNVPQAVTTEKHISELPSQTITVTPNVPQAITTEKHISELPSRTITVTTFVPLVSSSADNISQLPSITITVTPFVPTIEFFEDHISQLPSLTITVTPFVPTVVSTDKNISELPSQAITVTPFVPTIEAFQSQISQLPSQAIIVTPNVPQAVTTEKHISELPSQTITVTPFVPTAVTTEKHLIDLPSQAITVTPFVPQAITTEKHLIDLPSQAIAVTPFVPTVVSTDKNISELPSRTITVTPFVPLVDADESHEKIIANSKISDTGHSSCTLAALQNDDGSWCIASAINVDTESHVSFPTPANTNLLIGAGLQRLVANVRDNTNNEVSSPTARIELWEAGSLVRAGSNTTINQGDGNTEINFTFNANELSDQSGTDIEAKVITVADKEVGFSGSIDTGRICLVTQSGTDSVVQLPSINITLVPKIPQIESTEPVANVSQLPSQVIAVTPFVPTVVSTDKNIIDLPSQVITVTTFVPLVSSSADNIIQLPSHAITVTPFVPQIVVTEFNVSTLPSVTITLTPNVPTIEIFDPQTSQLPSHTITLTPFVPLVDASTNSEKIQPNSKISDTGHSSCTLADLQNHDANWCVASTITSSTISHVSFPTPAIPNLKVGAGLQRIEAHFRQNAGNEPSLPTARVELWESGSLVRAGSNTNVSASGETTINFTFNANELADQTGADIEVKTITTAKTEGGNSGSVDTGFICLITDSVVGNLSQLPSLTITLTPFVPTIEAFGSSFEKITPNAKVSDSGHSSCTLADLQNDDTNWCLATSITASTDSHVSFPTPANTRLKVSAALQKLITNVRDHAGNEISSPTARLELWEAGSLVRAGSNIAINQGSGNTEITLTFNANELSDQTGLNIEAKVITVAATEPGFSGSIDTGRICLLTDSDIGPISELPSQAITVTPGVPQVITTEKHLIDLPSQAITVTPFVPTVEAFQSQISQLPSQAITVTPFVPTVVSTDFNISSLPSRTITLTPFVPLVSTSADNFSELPSIAITVTPFVPLVSTSADNTSQLPSRTITVTPFVPTVAAFQSQISQLPSRTITLTPFVPLVSTSADNTSQLPSQAIVVTPFVPTVVSTDFNISSLPSIAITVTPFVPLVSTSADNTSQLPSQTITVTPFVPTIEAFQSQISQLPSRAIVLTPFVPLVVSTEEDAVPTTFRVGFATPTSSPGLGADIQIFKWWVRRDEAGIGGTGVPTADLFLFENGVQRQILQSGISVTSDSGQLIEGTWDAANLATEDGSLVEARLVTTVGGTGANARTIELGAVEWCVVYESGSQVQLPSVAITVTPFVPTVVSTEFNISALPSQAITVTPFVPTVEAFQSQISLIGAASIVLVPQVPQVVVTENNISAIGTAVLTVSPQAPTIVSTDNRVSLLGSIVITLIPQVPQVVITEHLGGTDDLTLESLSKQYTFAILPQVAVDTRLIQLSVKRRTVQLTLDRTTVSLSNISTIKEV